MLICDLVQHSISLSASAKTPGLSSASPSSRKLLLVEFNELQHQHRRFLHSHPEQGIHPAVISGIPRVFLSVNFMESSCFCGTTTLALSTHSPLHCRARQHQQTSTLITKKLCTLLHDRGFNALISPAPKNHCSVSFQCSISTAVNHSNDWRLH